MAYPCGCNVSTSRKEDQFLPFAMIPHSINAISPCRETPIAATCDHMTRTMQPHLPCRGRYNSQASRSSLPHHTLQQRHTRNHASSSQVLQLVLSQWSCSPERVPLHVPKVKSGQD